MSKTNEYEELGTWITKVSSQADDARAWHEALYEHVDDASRWAGFERPGGQSQIYDVLRRLDVCELALCWAVKYRDIESMWKGCQRADWMLFALDEARDPRALDIAYWHVDRVVRDLLPRYLEDGGYTDKAKALRALPEIACRETLDMACRDTYLYSRLSCLTMAQVTRDKSQWVVIRAAEDVASFKGDASAILEELRVVADHIRGVIPIADIHVIWADLVKVSRG